METKNWIASLAKLTFVEMVTRFPDETSAIVYLEAVRWADGANCSHCGCVDVSRVASDRKRPLWYCTACKRQFSVTTGTVMEDTKIALHKWLLAVNLMCSSKKGVSSLQLSRMLGIAKRSAWHLSHRIRHAMEGAMPTTLSGVVEADEVYVGGKVHGKGRGYRGNKVAMVAIVERGGNVLTHVMPDDSVKSSNVTAILEAHVEPTAVLNTDESPIYTEIGKSFAGHDRVNHGKEEYVRFDLSTLRLATTNTVEGYFGNFDRQINGTHHHVGGKHLHRYSVEFNFKYNSRKVKDGQRTVDAVRLMEGRRLTLYRAVSVKAPCLIDRVITG